MRKGHASIAVVLSALALAALGCSKHDAKSEGTPSASAASTVSSAAGCIDKLAGLKATSTPDEKKSYAVACSAVSPKAQACIASIKTEEDMDACIADKADREAFLGAILASAAKAGAAASAAPRTAKLDRLGLEIDLPGEPSIGAGTSKSSVMINTVAFGQVIVGPASPSTAKTLKAAKAAVKSFKPTNVHGEQAPDNYWLTFQAQSLYWVKTLQKVGKNSYTCETAVDSPDKASAALAACKTLRS
jgi:hypothetical protein